MTTRRRATTLLLALAILAFLTLACVDWDGLDRDEWHKGPTATFAVPDRGPLLPTPPPTPVPQ
jgi:hypothetical protein